MAHIALFGATGTIGARILDEALARGHRVTALLRDPAKLEKEHEALTKETVADVFQVTSAQVTGYDVVVSSVNGDVAGATRALVSALRGVEPTPRLIVVNGAGSLETAPGVKVWDTPGLPDFLLEIMHAHGDALDFLRTVEDVSWTAFSPAKTIAPGERTGTYRTGTDQVVSDEAGESKISAEDYAVALVDEIEKPAFLNQRFTAAN
ncbi:NAD(P)H-binding protein [Saccharothrix violaceirubra]|uniref:NAD(P)-binding domain-containing protein n=1 Tax=Saccharothrix violaceirubra TaxID=413306 RepID=A0A7W7T3U8_9PSEU|nr:NAD(P)H-binding protein [Saccharothrix violaceirubra]MBB4966039.1 hypothetical protein [Saccharothrix violaceirubra]